MNKSYVSRIRRGLRPRRTSLGAPLALVAKASGYSVNHLAGLENGAGASDEAVLRVSAALSGLEAALDPPQTGPTTGDVAALGELVEELEKRVVGLENAGVAHARAAIALLGGSNGHGDQNGEQLELPFVPAA